MALPPRINVYLGKHQLAVSLSARHTSSLRAMARSTGTAAGRVPSLSGCPLWHASIAAALFGKPAESIGLSEACCPHFRRRVVVREPVAQAVVADSLLYRHTIES